MAYTARTLITEAFYLSGLVGEGFQTVSGPQLTIGLRLLNNVLRFFAARTKLIPYYQREVFTGVVDQEAYFIENMSNVDALTFNLQTVRYSMERLDRKSYFNVSRANNVNTLPYVYTIEPTNGGCTVYVYPKPNQAYEFEASDKSVPSNVTQDTDMSVNQSEMFLFYLQYALAEKICQQFNITFTQSNKMELNRMEGDLMQVSPPDYSVTKRSALTGDYQLNYAIANLANGFLP